MKLGKFLTITVLVLALTTMILTLTVQANPGAPPASGSISGTIWCDADGNGELDAGEAGIEGVKVTLTLVIGDLEVDLGYSYTDANGYYEFVELDESMYIVGVDSTSLPEGVEQTYDYDDGTGPFITSHTAEVPLVEFEMGKTDVNFGYTGCYVVEFGSIGDFVWEDLNYNGVQDVDEPGISEVTVKLYTSTDTLVATTTTDATGQYLFSNLMPGSYYLVFTAPAGYSFTLQNQGDDALDSDADTTTGQTMVTTLESGENDMTWDAGLYQLASIGDFVWRDLNANGIQDASEPGIGGVTVNLYHSDGSSAGSTTTDENGFYHFTGLMPGGYYLVFTKPGADYLFSPKDQGGDNAKDSDTNTITGQTIVTTLESGENDMTWDAGLYQLASIGDFVWHDLFHSEDHQVDGIQDNGEPGINGVVVELRDSYGNVVATTTTTDSPITGLPGWYEFANLDAGTYIVKVADSNFAPGGVLEGWYASPPDRGNDTLDSDGNATTHQATVTLAPGEHNPTIDFGFFYTCIDLQKTGPVSVTIGANITYHFVVTNCGDLVHHGGAHVYDPLINPYNNHEIWSGVVWPGEVYEFDKTYTTGTGGNGYKFDRTYISVTDSDDDGNSWTVEVKCPPSQDDCGPLVNIATAVGHPKHPDGYYVADVTDQASWTVEVECPPSPAALGDLVWKDANGNGIQDWGEFGIQGVTVKLLGSDGSTVLATTTTGFYGNYSFTNLAAGTYFVQFIAPSGYTFTTKNATGSTTANDSNADVTTGKTDAITLSAGQTDNTIDAGLKCTPPPSPAALGDLVWKDANGNGIQDWGEFGIAGVTVKLLGSDGTTVLKTTTTDFYGKYSFTGLTPGIYYVQFAAPSGYTFTTKNATGSTTANDSNADVSTGKTEAITLSAGQTDNTIDAGLKCTPPPSPAALGDLVWKDVNENGIQDWGEPGIAGVTVKLLGSDGSTVLATTTTGFYGNYSFTNLAPGTYYVQFIAPSGYTFTTQYAGDAGKDSNANVSTGKTDAITLSAGQTDNTIDAGLYQPASCGTNLCGYIRTPGFWKNYSNHMSDATFLNLIQHTQDFSGLTVQQAVEILSKNNPAPQRFLKFLLTAELNAIWNGQDNAAGLGGQLGTGIYLGGQTVNQLLHQAYLDRNNFTSAEEDYVVYLGSGGEGQCASACRVQSCPAPPSLAALGDFVWKDVNGNGIQDWGEPGIAGVTVKLLGSDGSTVLATTTTDFYGKYSFTNLAAGTYYVQFIAPSGYTFTTQYAGDAGKDSNANVSTGKTDAITLSAGQTDNTIDAGLKCTPPPSPAALGDLVWKDVNGNGIQEWGEFGIAGVTVKLLSSDGSTVLATTTTGFYGKYSFTNLAPGTYYVQFITPSGYTFTTQYAGDAGKDSNANVSTGKTDAITLSAGQTDNTIDAGLKSTTQPPSTNMCAFIRTPGFWKNYSNHMSEATFQAILNATQDYQGTTPAQAVTILSTNQPSFPKFLLSAELNAAWNGQDNSAAPGGQLGLGIYNGTSSLNGMTVNEIVKLGYRDQLNPTQDEIDAINYLGGGGENVGACACLVH